MTRFSLAFVLGLVACGGSSKPAPAPTPAPVAAPANGVELGELTFFIGADATFKLHSTGASEINNGKAWSAGPTFKADGTIEENGVAKAKINADGSISGIGTADKVDMKIEGDKATIPVDKGTLELTLGADGKITMTGLPVTIPPDKQPRVEGADTPGKRRTALIITVLVVATETGDKPAAPPATTGQPTN
ncbi:MAG: hypothetical protein QM831_36610 [Kofleriaceae bacterium]